MSGNQNEQNNKEPEKSFLERMAVGTEQKRKSPPPAGCIGCLTVLVGGLLMMWGISNLSQMGKTKLTSKIADSDVMYICQEAIRTVGEYDVKIGFLPYLKTTEPITYTDAKGEESSKHVLKYHVKFQNAYGAYKKAMCHCGVDSNTGSLVDFECY